MFLFSPTNSLASFMTSVNQCCGVLLFLVPGSSTLKILCPIYPTFPLPPPYSLLSVSDCTFYIQFSPPVCTFLHSSPLFLPLVNISFHYSHFSYCSSECNYYTSDCKVIRSSPALFSFMIPSQQKRRKKVAFLLIAPQESESSHCAASF